MSIDPVPQPPGVIRVPDVAPLGMLHVVMLFVVGAVVAGSCLLLSAAESTALVDGAVDWGANSPLRAVVQLLCLGYEFPTINAGEVKNYALGMGAGLALLSLTIAVLSRSHGGEESGAVPGWYAHPPIGLGSVLHREPALAAMALLACFLLWSFASSRWSSAPSLSLAGSVLVTTQFLWALALAHGLNQTAAKICTRVIVAISAVVSAVAIWYFYGRNPVLAAKFPFGNPSFLAASLIPGIVLAVTAFLEQWTGGDASRSGRRRRFLLTSLSVVAFVGCVWAFYLARSRGPAVGLVFGLLTVAFVRLRRWWKCLPVAVALVLIAAGGWYAAANLNAPSPTGRSATMRFRLYAWDYAWQMFTDRPLAGHGQGGFVLHGDSFAVRDALADPLPLSARVEHAHCEWLEIAADLGVIGALLIAGVIAATLAAAVRALRHGRAEHRWVIAGLAGAFVALIVEESFGVGLRVSGVPTMFHTVLGLLWATSLPQAHGLIESLSATPNRRIFAGVIGGILGLAALVVTQQDFEAARSAFRAVRALNQGEDGRAAEYAANSLLRLSPQRTLESTYRFAETNLAAAEGLVSRGLDRSRRAVQAEPLDAGLQALAQNDLQAAEAYAQSASRGLQRLVSASPGFINSGVLEARANLLEAQIAALRRDLADRDRFLKTAAAAIEREITRQPFSPQLAVEYARIAGFAVPTDRLIEILARPLRHHRAEDAYVAVIAEMLDDPRLADALTSLPTDDHQADDDADRWLPERLRLGGVAAFLKSDFQTARERLAVACPQYEPIAGKAPVGAASCYAELADVTFFADPLSPTQAIGHAERAIALTPSSEQGREIAALVEQRMVYYYLAAGREPDAEAILRKSGSADVTDAAVRQELGVRLRRLCESILRKGGDRVDAPGGAPLLDALQRWIHRSMALGPQDVSVHLVAAQIALLRNDAERFARELTAAVEKGATADVVRQALEAADQAGVTHPLLDRLRSQLAPQPQPPAEEPSEPTPAPANAEEQTDGP